MKKLVMEYDNFYIRNALRCSVCGYAFGSGGIQFLICEDGKTESICPECVRRKAWPKDTLLPTAEEEKAIRAEWPGEWLL